MSEYRKQYEKEMCKLFPLDVERDKAFFDAFFSDEYFNEDVQYQFDCPASEPDFDRPFYLVFDPIYAAVATVDVNKIFEYLETRKVPDMYNPYTTIHNNVKYPACCKNAYPMHVLYNIMLHVTDEKTAQRVINTTPVIDAFFEYYLALQYEAGDRSIVLPTIEEVKDLIKSTK